MKTIFVTLFLGICSMAFGKSAIVENDFLDSKKLEIKIPVKKKAKMKQPKTMIAYEYYYTVDWLYAETPFSHKLEAYV